MVKNTYPQATQRTRFFSYLIAGIFVLWSGDLMAQSDSKLVKQYEALLSGAVKGTLVDYNAVERERTTLMAYVNYVAKATPEKWNRSEKLAFYINAYNALVLHAVLLHQRPARVLDVDGFFDKIQYTVAGGSMTLNALEEQKIRRSGDPRVHFVVNCASYDCPPLAPFLYRGRDLDAQLEKQTRLFLKQKNAAYFTGLKNNIEISELFKWYEKDWGLKADVVKFIARYRPDLSSKLNDQSLQLTYRKYNWNLNKHE